jgi:DNA repair protein RadD
MLPRPYQSDLVRRAANALQLHGNTLAVAPTGSGKTIMMSMLLSELPGRQMILQHREELVIQNRNKYHLINPKRTSSIYGLSTKDTSGDTIFGMAQTLGRNGGMECIPPLDVLIIDEAHHARADTYLRIVDAAKSRNPECLIAGFTATASRGDKLGLRPTFTNVCDLVTMRKLVDLGFLVPPRTFIATLPGLAEEIQKVRKTSGGEYDLDQVETLMNTTPINDAVIREWKKIAGDRKTIVFASTIRHAQAVYALFRDSGVNADCVFGDTPNREEILKRFEFGDLHVLCNVAVLTEGYDCPPASCIILLRPCSFKSTMLQMIGRGLRIVDPEEHPGVVKRDCIVLDFGESIRAHGDLEQGVRLDDAETVEGEQKECPGCYTLIPAQARECPVCGYEYPASMGKKKGKEYSDVVIMEVDLLKKSPFKWVDLFNNGKVLVASGFKAWVIAASANGEDWISLGKLKGSAMRRLSVGMKLPALSMADDFLRMNEDSDAAKKSKRWMTDQPSAGQLELLAREGVNMKHDFNLNKYEASCLLNFLWHQDRITKEVLGYAS